MSENKEIITKEKKDGEKNILIKKRIRKKIKRKKKKIKNKTKEENNLNNIIIGNIHIEEGYLTQRIINSFENVKKENPDDMDEESKENEKKNKRL